MSYAAFGKTRSTTPHTASVYRIRPAPKGLQKRSGTAGLFGMFGALGALPDCANAAE